MRSEIGSEFWDIPLNKEENGLFPPNTAWFLSGRDALRAVIRDIRARRHFCAVAMPSWCCDSMIRPFLEEGVEVRFYPVYPGEDGSFIQELSSVRDCDGLLLMDYFGFRRQSPSNFDGVIIWDATHSIFSGIPEEADYVFGSLRKWAGFWTGGFAWRKNSPLLDAGAGSKPSPYVRLRQQAMKEKRAYLEGLRDDKRHLETFSAAEELLEGGASGPADARDIRAAKTLDVDFLRRRRRENASVLLEAVSDMALFPKLEEADCPLFVPILVPEGKRDALRRFLIQREIYCPVHWPVSPLHRLTGETRRLYGQELSLVCDQRYDPADMARLCTAIGEFFKQEN